MRIRKIRVFGFQSFADSGEIELSEGINLIVGQNNAGKSALLRSFLSFLPDDRHRTPALWEDTQLPTPKVHLELEVSGAELKNAILRTGHNYFPVPSQLEIKKYIEYVFGKEKIHFSIVHEAQNAFTSDYPSHQLFDRLDHQFSKTVYLNGRNGKIEIQENNSSAETLPQRVQELWNSSSFYFTAERVSVGKGTFGHAARLSPNANNLPAVLQTLSGERGDLFTKLVEHLREIFPTVGNLSVRPASETEIEIRVWPTHSQNRYELSFPLNSSGTGVSQVAAILTAIMTAENTVIIIDEINSFLHPAAVKSLLRILQTDYKQHQYIISTHAPEVIGFSNPSTIHLVTRKGYQSSVQKLVVGEVDNLREIAAQLGISMSDVFAAERVVWVEGPTEELCFPFIYQLASKHPLPQGTIFTSVIATGDFTNKSRNRDLIYDIYSRLTQAAAPLNVSVCFGFDSEDLSAKEKEDMVRKSRGKMHFLPRRQLECFTINVPSIMAFIIECDVESIKKITFDQVEKKLIEIASQPPLHIKEWNGQLENAEWQAKVDASKILEQTISSLTDQRVAFKKKKDTLLLLQYTQDLNPDQLNELKNYVKSLVEFS